MEVEIESRGIFAKWIAMEEFGRVEKQTLSRQCGEVGRGEGSSDERSLGLQ